MSCMVNKYTSYDDIVSDMTLYEGAIIRHDDELKIVKNGRLTHINYSKNIDEIPPTLEEYLNNFSIEKTFTIKEIINIIENIPTKCIEVENISCRDVSPRYLNYLTQEMVINKFKQLK